MEELTEITADDDPTISRLLALSDYYLGQSPPIVSESVRCLLALLTLAPPPRIEARARLQLGLVLYHHTNNLAEARQHLDRAVLISQSAANLHDVSFEASSLSVRIMVGQKALHQAKSLLRARLDHSAHHPYWNIRLLLQLADIYLIERDENAVLSTLDRCISYAKQVNATYTRLLCLLYKGAFLLTHHHYHEAGEVLNITNTLEGGYHGNNKTLVKTFYLVVQVTHLLMAGQVKAAKPHLKQLQQQVKVLGSESQTPSQSDCSTRSPDSFQWLTKEQTFILVYLVSVMHSVQGGYTDKAMSYTDKAMQLIAQDKQDSGVVSVLKAHLLEHTISCLLMQGRPTAAGEKLQEVLAVCHGHPQLVYSHRAVLHTLLGHYALATESTDRAIQQFNTALQHTNNSDLRSLVSVNLAVAYMKSDSDHHSELKALIQALTTDTPSCHSIKAAISYVQGLYMYSRMKLHDAKCHLRESLLLSNKHDLNKLTSCALIILGQIFLALGNTKETQDMAAPAMQLALKIPEKRLQVWASSLLADLYHTASDKASESSSRQQVDKTSLEISTEVTKAVSSPSNRLAQWTVGEWPVPMTTQQSYQAPVFQRTKPEQIPPHPSRHHAAIDSPRGQHRLKHTKHDNSQDSSQGGGRNAHPDTPSTPRSLKNLELRLHDVVNSTMRPSSRSDSQSSSPLPSMKTPELRLTRVATTTGTPPTLFQEETMNHSPVKMDGTPNRFDSGHLFRPARSYHDQGVSMDTSQARASPSQVARMPNQVHNPMQRHQRSSQSQQQGFGPSQPPTDVHQASRQNFSPRNISSQLPSQASNVSPQTNLPVPGFNQARSLSPLSMPRNSPHHVPSPTNPLSHPQQTGQTGLPSYPGSQSPRNTHSPRLNHLDPSQAQQLQYHSVHQQPRTPEKSTVSHMPPVGLVTPPGNPPELAARHTGNRLDNRLLTSGQMQQGKSPQFAQGSNPMKNTLPTDTASLFRAQPAGVAQNLPQMGSLTHPTLQQSQEQAMLQQRMMQQQQQMIQAQMSQQRLLSMSPQRPTTSQPSILSHPNFNFQHGLPTAYYQQGMLAGLPQAMSSQHSPGQLTHMQTLQHKLGQEQNRTQLVNPAEQVRMPMLHSYRTPSPQQMQLLNGGNFGGGSPMQGSVYRTQGPHLFPFNPHQPGR